MEYQEYQAIDSYDHASDDHSQDELITGIYENIFQNDSLDSSQKFTLVNTNSENDGFDVHLLNTLSPNRIDIESFIKETFYKVHRANISTYLPNIFGAFNNSGKPIAAVGFKPISRSPLFLETYSSRPIEIVLSHRVQRTVPRTRIAEVGNLASQHPGACQKLFQLLVLYFYNNDIDWAVFTGTRAVRKAFDSINLNHIPLLKAHKEKLGNQQNQWGSYYENNPYVMACDIRKAMRNLSHNFQLIGA